jgi:small multidrug resistance family-3 protein
VAAAHVSDVRAKIAALRPMEDVLAETVARCEAGKGTECPLIERSQTSTGAGETVRLTSRKKPSTSAAGDAPRHPWAARTGRCGRGVQEGHAVTALAGSIALFALAGVCEIGGGYFVWQWWRNGAPWAIGAAGAVVLMLYGIVPTYQPAHFGCVYAAYRGVFVLLSMLWGWAVDCLAPDRSTSSGRPSASSGWT